MREMLAYIFFWNYLLEDEGREENSSGRLWDTSCAAI